MRILWRIAIQEDNAAQLSTTFSGKFGDDLANMEQARARFTEIAKMGVNLQGIHFHCGSGMNGADSFEKAIKFANKCMLLGRELGHQMQILDLGGGFPAGDLNEKLLEALKFSDPHRAHQEDGQANIDYIVYAEPGRHVCAQAFYLATRVLGKRVKKGKTCYHINDGIY